MFVLFSAVVRLLSLLPSRLLVMMSYPLGWLTWVCSTTKRNSTRVNLAACYPDLGESERERLGRESMRHYVLLALETGIAWYWSRARLSRHFDPTAGVEHLENAIDQGRGIVFLVPHFGNWEILQLWLSDHLEMVSLYKPGRYPEFEEKLRRKRKRFGGEMAPTNTAGIKTLVRLLKSGHGAIILPDQDPSEGQGRFVPFFGVQAHTPVLAARISRKTNCVAMMAVCERTAGGRFRPHFIPVEDYFYDEDMEAALSAMNRGIERCIEIDSAQYLWAYKRFKSRPEGEQPFYRRQ